jgi:peptidoglycan/LPS O-acetylase OafA/YrhL
MQSLAAHINNRKNNFTTIRHLAAIVVVYTHACVLLLPAKLDLLGEHLGINASRVAVDVFFFLSGLLLSASLVRSPDAARFIRARFARIYPGLLVCTVLSVMAFGAILSANLHDFWFNKATWTYLYHNTTLIFGVRSELPIPHLVEVNGSLWTLPWEIYMYAILVGLFSITSANRDSRVFDRIILILAMVFHVLSALDQKFHLAWGICTNASTRFPLFFLTGVAFNVLQKWIPVSAWFAGLAFGCLFAFSFVGLPATLLFYPILLPIIITGMSYGTPPLNRLNSLGDFSYGIYIYHMPVMNLLYYKYSVAQPLSLAFVTLMVVFPISVASWYLVERKGIELFKD